MKVEKLKKPQEQQCNIHDVISSPIELWPVLAEIEHINDLITTVDSKLSYTPCYMQCGFNL